MDNSPAEVLTALYNHLGLKRLGIVLIHFPFLSIYNQSSITECVAPTPQTIKREVFEYFQTIAREFSFETLFRQGDIQVLLNHVMVHTRKAFEDWPEIEQKRHLMRLWIVDEGGRTLAPGFRENFCGIDVPGIPHSAPNNVFEPA